MKTKWKSFNIRMPDELIPIYDFLQDELNYFLSDEKSRELLNNIDLSQHKGNVWREMRDCLTDRVKNWSVHNKTWHSYILYENLRRELQSKREKHLVYKLLLENENKIDESLFNKLHKNNCYPTRTAIVSVKNGGEPSLATSATFNLDYTISEKQFFRMSKDNQCLIKVGKKDWISYKIILPISLGENLTGKIAKPRFFKRKSDGKYIGLCSYEYVPREVKGDNILGIDIGLKKLYSGIILNNQGKHSHEYVNSKSIDNLQDKLYRLSKEREILYKKIQATERLNLTSDKNSRRQEHYNSIRSKIKNIKQNQSSMIAREVCEIAYKQNCKEIHIENLRWLNTQGGKWNHSEVHSKIEEKAEQYGIKVKRVSAYNSSKEHPMTKEVGEVMDRIVKFKHEKVDRDILGAINLALQGSKVKLKKLKPKVRQQKYKVSKSRKQVIKEQIHKLKGNAQIVTFLTNVPNEENLLGVSPQNLVGTYNSFLGCVRKLQL